MLTSLKSKKIKLLVTTLVLVVLGLVVGCQSKVTNSEDHGTREVVKSEVWIFDYFPEHDFSTPNDVLAYLKSNEHHFTINGSVDRDLFREFAESHLGYFTIIDNGQSKSRITVTHSCDASPCGHKISIDTVKKCCHLFETTITLSHS